MSYAILQDVYDLGFTARAFVLVPRAWNTDNGRSGDTIDTTGGTGVIRMAGHGYTTDDLVEFVLVTASAVPGTGGVLPTGAPSGVLLSPRPVDFFRFALYTSIGALVTYTTSGAGWGLQLDPERRLQRHLDDAATRIDRALVAQRPPIKVDSVTGKYPPEIVGPNARIAARSAAPTMTFEVDTYRQAMDRVEAMRAADEKMLEEWSMGKPLWPNATDQDTVADYSPRTNGHHPVGWGAHHRRQL
jgi:hypothetical protein